MPGVPVLYQDAEQQIASYDYTDIAEGTGVEIFYAYNSEHSAGTSRALTGNSSIYTFNIQGSFTTTTINYDLTAFNMPRTIKGTAIVRYSTHWTGTSSHTKYETVSLIKVDGSDASTTTIASNRSQTETGAGSAIIRNHVLAMVCTETNFKKGDILRVSIAPTNPQENTINIGEDPANRDGTNITPAATYPTKFEVFVPFKLNL